MPVPHGRSSVHDGVFVEYKKIQALMAVARFENFSKAATQLSVSQSLLSKYITELESELGLRLLHRTGRGARLTPEGERLIEHGHRIETLMQHAEEDVRGMRERLSGTVILGISAAIGPTLTVPVLTQAHARHPAVHLQLVEGISADVQEWLNTGRLDLAVVFDRIGSSAIVREEFLVEEELLLVSPASFQRNSTTVPGVRLQHLPLLLSRPGGKLRSVIDAYTQALGFQLQPIAEVDSVMAMIGAVESGLGHAILPYGAIRASLDAGKVAVSHLVSPGLSRALYLTQSTDRVPTRAARAIADIVREQALALDVQGAWRPADRMLSSAKA